jgi:hypothetical protein
VADNCGQMCSLYDGGNASSVEKDSRTKRIKGTVRWLECKDMARMRGHEYQWIEKKEEPSNK